MLSRLTLPELMARLLCERVEPVDAQPLPQLEKLASQTPERPLTSLHLARQQELAL